MKNTKYFVFIGIGMELLGIVISCLYIGKFIDERYHLPGFAMIGMTMLGLAGWFYHLIILIKQVEKNSPEEEAPNEETDKEKLH